ncbi:MAG: hypothetical protein Q8P81_02720 [Nanoarchaeota archaeon]|nr:hypothetical protein [Nanoarchaeota archaeon]
MERDDYVQKIVGYLRRNLKKGYTLDSLKWALIGQGYSKTSVERAIEDLNKEMAKTAPILKDKPTIKYEILDEDNNPIRIKNSWWKRFFRF